MSILSKMLKYIYVNFQAGVQDGGWGWGAAFLDFNNDGYQDIVMTNGTS